MKKIDLSQDKNPAGISPRSALEEVLREWARKMLQEAIEMEVAEYVQTCQELRDAMNKRLVTRNGYLPSRNIVTGIGSLNVRQPRVRDRRENEFFSSALLRKYKRRAPSIDAAVPELYLRGISTNNFPDALTALLGEKADKACPFAFVETMSFQALDFYRKMGFELEFTRSGYKHGTAFHYLRKLL